MQAEIRTTCVGNALNSKFKLKQRDCIFSTLAHLVQYIQNNITKNIITNNTEHNNTLITIQLLGSASRYSHGILEDTPVISPAFTISWYARPAVTVRTAGHAVGRAF
jgi:hypothetical protein